MSDVAKALLDHGVLGLLALLEIAVIVALYRENRRLVERYETKAESMLAKSEATLAAVRDLLAHYLRRRPQP